MSQPSDESGEFSESTRTATAPEGQRQATLVSLRRAPAFAAVLAGTAHVFEYANDAYRAISGDRALEGRPVRAVFPELEGQGFFEGIDEVFATGRTFSARAMPVQFRGDSRRYIDLLCDAIRDEAGAITGIFVVGHEVTERALAESALRQERDRFRRVLDGMGELFFLLSPEFRILDVNAEGVRLDGRPRQALIGATYWDACPGTETAEAGRALRIALARCEAVEWEHAQETTQPAGDTRTTWLGMRAYPVSDGLAVFGRDITRRRLAEQRAEDASDLLARFSDAVPGVVYVKDRQGRMRVANHGTTRLIGKPPEQYIGHTDVEFLDDKAQAEVIMATDRRIMESGVAEQIEEAVRLPDGTAAFWLSTKSPLRDASGAVIGLIGSSMDVTPRVEAEASLRRSQAQLSAVLDNATLAIFLFDGAGHCTYANPAAAALGGRSWQAVRGQRLEQLVPDPDVALPPGDARGESVRRRYLAHASGAQIPIEMTTSPVCDSDGRAVGTVVEVRAIAAELESQARQLLRVRLADALRGEDEPIELQRAALTLLGNHLNAREAGYGEVQPDTTWVTVVWHPDPVGTSGRRSDLLDWGRQPPNVPASGGTRVSHEAPGPTERGGLAERSGPTEHGGPERVTTRVVRDGALRAALWIESETPRAWPPEDVALIEDVVSRTWDALERARAKVALNALNAELDLRVQKRTAELEAAQAALRQSQKMEAVGQLTGGIAHDFNNMLAVVIGSLDLLARKVGGSDARAKRYIDAAADGARRAATLTQRLLAFSRQQPLRPEPLAVNKLVAGMSELLAHSLGAEIRLETILAGGLWRIHADPNQLENVILNLAVNGRDAMPRGGRLTIETQNAHLDDAYVAAQIGVQAGQYVLIAVSDTGSGMSDEVMAKAFDPFFTTKEVGKGTGLGLSQVYGFIKQSGGHVKIYSEVGHGSTVKIYLPRLLGKARPASEEASGEPEPPRGEQREVVLVVEDEPLVRQFSIEALTELGYRVLEADSAAAALQLLETHPEIVLLFTDVVMPDVNGRKLADEASARWPALKILFTTGYTRNAVVHNGVLDPGVEMIGKPFGIDELAAKVRQVLDS